jgi:N-acylneuraminate cytidylyltransferase
VSREGVLALIPARGGSKSIPRKNVRPLAGLPLISWSVAAARQAKSVDTVLVSTDDEEIRRVALAAGAEAPFLRPASLAEDGTTDHPVFEHALRWLERERGYRPAVVVQLRPTSPLRPPGMVDEGVALLAQFPEADSVRAVTSPTQNPYKMWRLHGRYLSPLLLDVAEEPYNMPRQKLPPTFWQTGHLEVIRRQTILGLSSMTGTRVLPLMVDPSYAIDIDTMEQWSLAEWLLREGRVDVVRPAGKSGDTGRGRQA